MLRLDTLTRVGRTAVVAFALIALAGCGGDDEPTGDVVQTVEVSLVDFAIEPATPQIAQTGTVRFEVTNDGQAQHSIEVEGPGGEAELESPLESGESGSLEVDLSEPGSYEWYCPVGDHRERGMRGEITVGAGAQSTVTQTEERATPPQTTEPGPTVTETTTTETQTETSETQTSEQDSGGGY